MDDYRQRKSLRYRDLKVKERQVKKERQWQKDRERQREKGINTKTLRERMGKTKIERH